MKRIIILLLMTAFAVSTFAQGKEKRKDKIREAKIEFIKKKLVLTADEEKKFLPLYTAFLDENDALRKTLKKDINLEDVDLTFMSDEDCEKLINEISEHKQKEVDLIKKYTAEFKKVLPIKKVAMVFKAEHEFRRYLVKELRGRSKEMREIAKKMREESRKLREERRKQLEESRKLREDSRKKIEESIKMLENSDLSKEEREKIKADIEKQKEEFRKHYEQLIKEFKQQEN